MSKELKQNRQPRQCSSHSRRAFLGDTVRVAGAISLTGVVGYLAGRQSINAESMVWQIDPDVCIACDGCETNCVLDVSAVKCYHAPAICGFCNRCSGYFEADAIELESGAENHMCPTNAIIRTFIEDPYYEFEIEQDLCIGCGKCVKGCGDFGNGSLFMQIDQDRCVNCNQCAIAQKCPSKAIQRRPANDPYLLKIIEDDVESMPLETDPSEPSEPTHE